MAPKKKHCKMMPGQMDDIHARREEILTNAKESVENEQENSTSTNTDNDDKLQDMINNFKRANVYKVGSKTELYESAPPKFDLKKIEPPKTLKRSRAADIPPIPNKLSKRQNQADNSVAAEKKFILISENDLMACCVGVGVALVGVYVLAKYTSNTTAEELTNSYVLDS